MEFENENVCTFTPPNPAHGDLHILHVVYETQIQRFNRWKTLSYYRLHYVTRGEGVLHTQNGEYRLSEGDLFFCLPSTPYALQSITDFRFVYIGYLGERANATAHKFQISVKNCVFKNFSDLSDLWEASVRIPAELTALRAEGVLLCTLSAIAARSSAFEKDKKEPQTASLIKKYIDENFASPELSLQSICDALSYNAKYISALFKREFKISFKEYLNVIRINNACALINKGFISVKDVSFLCGFNDPLYFSKVFKAKMGQAPSEYIAEARAKK